MPDRLTVSEVDAIASLARLALTDDERELFAQQLGDILEYVRQLQGIDTSGVPPTASVLAGHAASREDVVAPSLERDAALANAPDGVRDAGLFRVPRVIG